MNNYIGVCTRTKEADEFPFHPISFIYQTRSNEWTHVIVVSTVSISHSLLTKCRHSIKLHHQRFSLYSKMFTSNINRNRIDSFFSRVLIIAQLSWANAAPGSYRWVIFKQKSQQEKKKFFSRSFSQLTTGTKRASCVCVHNFYDMRWVRENHTKCWPAAKVHETFCECERCFKFPSIDDDDFDSTISIHSPAVMLVY